MFWITRYFKLRNIYKQITIRIRIPIFSSEYGGAGNKSPVLALVLNSENNFIIAKPTI